jgi:hypothetical protein
MGKLTAPTIFNGMFGKQQNYPAFRQDNDSDKPYD